MGFMVQARESLKSQPPAFARPHRRQEKVCWAMHTARQGMQRRISEQIRARRRTSWPWQTASSNQSINQSINQSSISAGQNSKAQGSCVPVWCPRLVSLSWCRRARAAWIHYVPGLGGDVEGNTGPPPCLSMTLACLSPVSESSVLPAVGIDGV